MPQYSYICTKCNSVETMECERGKAPRTIKCKENHDMQRQIKLSGTYDIEKSKEPMSKSDKVRKNLSIRREKLKRMDRKDRARFEAWSLDQTGGKW